VRIARGIDVYFAVVLVAAATAWTLPLRAPNCNTGSHYALVQAIVRGERTIDRFHGESCDVSWWRGNFYANKAPGLALVSTPWYELLRGLGVLAQPPHNDAFPAAMRALPRRDLWLMALWGAVLPSLGLLYLVRRHCERLVPGTGTAAAAVLAFGTILLPFGGLFFSHALGAFLVFASYTALGTTISARRAALSGVLVGLAVVVEYPNVVAAAVLAGIVAFVAGAQMRSLASYLAWAAVGVAPLLAFNAWAFGDPLHVSYRGAVLVPGRTGHDVLGANSAGFFGVQTPTLQHVAALLAGGRGLLLTAPLLVLVPFGLQRLARMGLRREAISIGALALAFLVYNAGYYSPAGGATPGPRFLIAALPFLALPTVVAAQLLPRLAAGLLAAGSVVLFAADATQPLIGHSYSPVAWWHWLHGGAFTPTVLDPGADRPATTALLALAIAAGLAAGVASAARWRHDRQTR
jgi:hypothetical protein